MIHPQPRDARDGVRKCALRRVALLCAGSRRRGSCTNRGWSPTSQRAFSEMRTPTADDVIRAKSSFCGWQPGNAHFRKRD